MFFRAKTISLLFIFLISLPIAAGKHNYGRSFYKTHIIQGPVQPSRQVLQFQQNSYGKLVREAKLEQNFYKKFLRFQQQHPTEFEAIKQRVEKKFIGKPDHAVAYACMVTMAVIVFMSQIESGEALKKPTSALAKAAKQLTNGTVKKIAAIYAVDKVIEKTGAKWARRAGHEKLANFLNSPLDNTIDFALDSVEKMMDTKVDIKTCHNARACDYAVTKEILANGRRTSALEQSLEHDSYLEDFLNAQDEQNMQTMWDETNDIDTYLEEWNRRLELSEQQEAEQREQLRQEQEQREAEERFRQEQEERARQEAAARQRQQQEIQRNQQSQETPCQRYERFERCKGTGAGERYCMNFVGFRNYDELNECYRTTGN